MNFFEKIKLWFKSIKELKSIYFSIFVHFYDIITDILIIIQFYKIVQNELINNPHSSF